MTTLEHVREKIVANSAVTTLVGTKVYPQKAPQGTVVPYIILTVVTEVPQNSFSGEASTRLLIARVQIDSYGKSYAEAHQVADAVDEVVANLSFPEISAFRETSDDLYEEETQLHRVSADYMVSR